MKSFILLFVVVAILATSKLTLSSPISPSDGVKSLHQSTAAHSSVNKDAETADPSLIISQHGEHLLKSTKTIPSNTIPFVSNANFQRFRRDEISDYEGWEK